MATWPPNMLFTSDYANNSLTSKSSESSESLAPGISVQVQAEKTSVP